MSNTNNQNTKDDKAVVGAFRCTVFGEKTFLPIEIRKAVIRTWGEAPVVAYLNQALVSVELDLVNATVNKDKVSAKLHLTLPVTTTASVKRFELHRPDGVWYPATAVPKNKAAAVVYREKEKGRAVAAVSNAAAASNVFEMEISPMPFEQIVKCRLEIMVPRDDRQQLVDGLFPKPDSTTTSTTQVIIETLPGGQKPQQDRALLDSTAVAGSVVGSCFGKTHFCCKIPCLSHEKFGKAGSHKNVIHRMAILQDTSASMIPSKDTAAKRAARLRELLCAAAAEGADKSEIVVELYTFDILSCEPRGIYSNVNDLIHALESVEYDGGTNLSVLSETLTQLGARSTNQLDCVLVVTDGVDSTMVAAANTTKPVVEAGISSFPIHCIADGEKIHLPTLYRLAAISPNRPGSVLTKKDDSYLPGVLYPRAVLRRIRTNQEDQAFVQEVDDGFRCVPDHRLGVLNQPIPSDGILIAGILGDGEDDELEQDSPASVTHLIAEVLVGGCVHEFIFHLSPQAATSSSCCWNPETQENLKESAVIHDCPTQFLGRGVEKSSHSTAALVDPARILGHLYAEQVYRQTELDGLKSGMNHKALLQEIAVEYGFCSPESSLLMLYERDQFLEHGISPPVGHPLEPTWRKQSEGEAAARAQDDGKKKPVAKVMGEIGGPKNELQTNDVKRLALTLNDFFSPSPESARACDMMEATNWLRNMEPAGNDEWQQREAPLCSAGPPVEEFGEEKASEEMDVNGRLHMMCICDCKEEGEEENSLGRESMHSGSSGGSLGRESMHSGSSGGGDTGDMVQEHACYDENGAGWFIGSAVLASSGSSALPMDTTDAHDDCDGVPVSMPKTLSIYLTSLTDALSRDKKEDESEISGDNWKTIYKNELVSQGGHSSASPSLFLNTAQILAKFASGKTSRDAIRIATNCLEAGIEDVQMLRSVGYVLLSISTQGSNLALRVFDKVKELAPNEPQSYIDSSLARFKKSWNSRVFMTGDKQEVRTTPADVDSICQDLVIAQTDLVHVLTHAWADRFNEVEWAVLILLHFIKEMVEAIRASSEDILLSSGLCPWPSAGLKVFDDSSISATTGAALSEPAPLYCPKFDPALMVWLGWDTDKTDVDLHVMEPSLEEVYFGNKRGTASCLSRDFQRGYGPEVYLVKNDGALTGEYEVHARYFTSHQDSALTGTTSAVLWTIEKVPTTMTMTGAGGSSNIFSKWRLQFDFVRLDTHKQKSHVSTATVPPDK